MSPLPLEPPSHLLPHSISLGCHRTSDLSSEYHTANSQWLSISHLVMYMLQWYSLNSSHLLLPLCPEVCFYVCTSFAAVALADSSAMVLAFTKWSWALETSNITLTLSLYPRNGNCFVLIVICLWPHFPLILGSQENHQLSSQFSELNSFYLNTS